MVDKTPPRGAADVGRPPSVEGDANGDSPRDEMAAPSVWKAPPQIVDEVRRQKSLAPQAMAAQPQLRRMAAPDPKEDAAETEGGEADDEAATRLRVAPNARPSQARASPRSTPAVGTPAPAVAAAEAAPAAPAPAGWADRPAILVAVSFAVSAGAVFAIGEAILRR